MALTVTELVASTLFHQAPQVADNFTNNCALVRRMKSRNQIKLLPGGYEYRRAIAYQETNADWYSDWEQFDTSEVDNLTCSVWEYKNLGTSVVISGPEKRKNSGKDQIIDLVDQKVEIAQGTMINKVSKSVYGSGSDPKELDGLAKIVSATPTATATVGGIAQADYSWWQNVEIDSTTDLSAAMSSSNAVEQFTHVWTMLCRGGDKPDLAIVNNAAFRFLHAELQGLQRFTSDSDVAKAGFPTIRVLSMDVVLDGGYGDTASSTSSNYGVGSVDTDATAFILNTKYLGMFAHKDAYFAPLGSKVREAVDQDGTVQLLGFMGNLWCSNRQLQGFLGD